VGPGLTSGKTVPEEAMDETKGRQPEQQETRIQAASVKREDSIAVSHAVEGKSDGSKPLEGTPIHMVGGTPTIQAKLGGVDVRCVVDSGSMVSFVTEDFYRKKLHPTCGRVKRREQMLTLGAANWLEIPYMGYVEPEIEVDGVKVSNCRVLVLRDTPATSKQRKDVPGLLGTNVPAQIPEFGALLQQRTNGEPRKSETCTSGCVRVAGSYPVMIPPNSVSSVAVTGPACGPTAMVEPLSVPVPGNIQVANTLVNASKTCFHIQVVNPTSRDVYTVAQATNTPWYNIVRLQ